MRRRLLPLLALAVAGLAAPVAAAAPTHDVDVPALLADPVAQVKARSDVPIRLPESMPTEEARLFGSGTGHRRSWALGLDAVAECGGANACFVASFTGERGGRPYGARRVTLTGGRVGRFTPLSCGASCAAPQIQWRQGSTLYTIQARVGTTSTERRILVRMANSAIRHGRR